MNSQNKKSLQIVLVVLIAVLTLGIGYASITAINLIISGNATASASQENFKVKFLEEENVTPTITSTDGGTGVIDVTSDTTATFNISGLDAAGESATANYVVKNVSEGIGAKITINLTSTNTEYFKVTTTVVDDTLQAGEETDVRVKVEMLKTPIESAVSTNITATLTATPIDDAEASGGEEKEVVKPTPYTYTFHKYDNTYVTIGQPLASGERTFNNFAAAKAEFGHPVVLAHKIEDGKVESSYVVFEKDNKIYYLRGGAGNEFGQASMPIYDANVAVLKEAFGPTWSDYCFESVGNDYRDFYCGDGSWNADADTHGGVYAGGSDWGCYVYYTGNASCHD